MVLSNKKLKQKLRAELVESSAKSQPGDNSNIEPPTNPDSNSEPQCSLKRLLDSASRKPRFSKREKRRKARTFPEGGDAVIGYENKDDDEGTKENGSEGSGKQKNNKKRKRKIKEEDVANGVVKDTKKSKKKDKKKKKKKKQKKAKAEEENNANPKGEMPEAVGLNKSSSSQEIGDVPTKVYCGGIPYYSTEDDIRSYFEGCGTITEVDCMKFPESGKFRGIAIISFKTEAAAKRALALDGADMGGLFLKIQPYKTARVTKVADFAPEVVEGYNRIYIGNLSWDITEDELRKLFSNCSISSIRFGMDKDTGEFRGYAHVDFTDSQSLKSALTLDQKIVCGRPVRITCAVPLKKAESNTSSVPTNNGVDSEKSSSTGSGKMKRRTCYECGEKGHISSACPKKQTVSSTTS